MGNFPLAAPTSRTVAFRSISKDVSTHAHHSFFLKIAVCRRSVNDRRSVGNGFLVRDIAPCHRVIGASGALTGFAGGLKIKETLLTLKEAFYHPAMACSKSGSTGNPSQKNFDNSAQGSLIMDAYRIARACQNAHFATLS